MTGRLRRWLSLLGGLTLLVAALPAQAQLWPGYVPGLKVYVIGRYHNAMIMVEHLLSQGIAAETYAATEYAWCTGAPLLAETTAAETAGAATISAGNVGWMQAAAGEVLAESAQIIVVGEGIGPISVTEAAIATQVGAEITQVAVPGSAVAVEAAAAEAEAAVSAVGAITGTTVAPVVVGAVVVAGTVIIAVEVGAIIYYCHQAGGLTQCFVDPSSPPSPIPPDPDDSTSADAGTSGGGSSGGSPDGGSSYPGGATDAGSPDSTSDAGSSGGGGSPSGGGTPDAGTVGLYGYCGCSWSSMYCGGSCQPGLYCDWTGTCVRQQ